MSNHLETGEAADSMTAVFEGAFCSGSMERRIRQTAQHNNSAYHLIFTSMYATQQGLARKELPLTDLVQLGIMR